VEFCYSQRIEESILTKTFVKSFEDQRHEYIRKIHTVFWKLPLHERYKVWGLYRVSYNTRLILKEVFFLNSRRNSFETLTQWHLNCVFFSYSSIQRTCYQLSTATTAFNARSSISASLKLLSVPTQKKTRFVSRTCRRHQNSFPIPLNSCHSLLCFKARK
jgi:hypothetical protein